MNIELLEKLEKHVSEFNPPLAESMPKDPFMILISTILSARTRDETTARVCKELFKKVRKPIDLKKMTIKELESIIKPVNFYKNKATYLKGLRSLKQVPSTMNELLKIKGVGRKTANIVLNVAFGKSAIAVDTHVHRISNLLGLVNTKTPIETERSLRDKLPLEWWSKINYILVLHGQHTCKPTKQYCNTCPINNECPRTRTRQNP